mmetsp:Transcript_31553/g.51441  ORF Transcript_31553/g.51441 Transcript_31553/m.51441 type:complete len:201 (-) Transcript_31553:156-758(-)
MMAADHDAVEADEEVVAEHKTAMAMAMATGNSNEEAEAQDQGVFLCRKCRHQIFNVEDLEDHEPRMQTFHRLKARNLDSGIRCTSYFLTERLEWMGDMADIEGKLNCPNPKCNARLGHYKWAGSQCSCGSWVAPAMQIPMSKIDLKIQMNLATIQIVDAAGAGEVEAKTIQHHPEVKVTTSGNNKETALHRNYNINEEET